MKYKLLKSEEVYIPHYGLRVDALYQLDPLPSILYAPQKIRFWNHHAPVQLEADLVEIKFGVPHVQMDKDGRIKRTRAGYPVIILSKIVFCPKTSEGSYYEGYSPAAQKARLLKRLMPYK